MIADPDRSEKEEAQALEGGAPVVGGFCGNFLLSVFDHAQNGFFKPTEWIPVISAAIAIGILLVALAWPSPGTYRACAWVMVLQALVGFAGLGLHVAANLEPVGMEVPMADRFVYGAPAFAPLLFVNIALLVWIGVWAALSAGSLSARAPSSPGGRSGSRTPRAP